MGQRREGRVTENYEREAAGGKNNPIRRAPTYPVPPKLEVEMYKYIQVDVSGVCNKTGDMRGEKREWQITENCEKEAAIRWQK